MEQVRKPLTEQQKSYIVSHRSEDYKNAFDGKKLFDEKTRKIRVPKDMFSELKMRSWLTNSLLKIPFSNLNVDEDTYLELVEQKCEDMEWGVAQKAISIILGLPPSDFGVDVDVEALYNCPHTKSDEVKYCDRCKGGGYVKGVGVAKTKEELINLSYAFMVKNLRRISNWIVESVGAINDELKEMEVVAFESIWYDKMTAGERHNANGLIERGMAKAENRPVSKVNILKA